MSCLLPQLGSIPTVEWEVATVPGKKSVIKPHNLSWQLLLMSSILKTQRKFAMTSWKEGNHIHSVSKIRDIKATLKVKGPGN